MNETLLEVRDLRVGFRTRRGLVQAVDGVSYSLGRGEALGIVGESGSGKTVSSLAMLRLFGLFDHVEISGEIIFEGRDLLALSERKMQSIRGKEIGMVFQDPLTSLNPVMSVGDQVAESIVMHTGRTPAQARERVVELLERVGIPDPEQRYHDRPHSFSGGMRQRIMVAIAVACEPKLLIADEPTTALDVTVQAQILKLLDDLRREMGMAMVMITHDFGVVAATCDKVLVMYAAQPMEECSVEHLFQRANHPYTDGLLRLVPRFERRQHHRLHPIEGQPPELTIEQPGCVFAPRCEVATDICHIERPAMFRLGPGHASACHLADERAARVTVPDRPWEEIR
ncbi:MAG TPA: ABC transporter ATP-binding protein [Ilumatobacter sp.]|nr:ABC transporter ATP-binding protein [Ilumatobacter sp.]